MIGRPGCGVLQMNGQPTAQNTRETGCDGEFPASATGRTPSTSSDWRDSGTSTPRRSRTGTTHAHAMEIFRHAETGLDQVPVDHRHQPGRLAARAAPHPQDPRAGGPVRGRAGRLPDRDRASWPTWCCRPRSGARRPGTFTNIDRTVHISHKAVEPPGEARSDLDIFLDFARRMDFRDKDGQPLVKWNDAEGAFEPWKECSQGLALRLQRPELRRSCTGGSGIQWPCNEEHPDGDRTALHRLRVHDRRRRVRDVRPRP